MNVSKIKLRNNINLIKSKGGVLVNAVLSVLRDYDRMPNNQGFPDGGFVEKVLDLYGYLTLFVFVCPATRGKYLTTDKKELFMPSEEPGDGLMFARIPKLKALMTGLWSLGVPCKLLFVVADNSYELYRGPVEGVILDTYLMDERRKLYETSLSSRLAKEFQQMFEVFSLGLNKVGLFSEELEIPDGILAQEMAFQKKVVFGQYYGKEPPADEVIAKIVRGKCLAYAEQGILIETADALLIGTEGAADIASWLLRTNMLQLGGAKFPVIYPYIRKEVLGVEVENKERR